MPNWLPKMLYEFSAPSGNVWGPHPSILWPIRYNYAAAAKLLQSCLTLGDPIDSSPAGSLVPWILQARTLEWVAISFSNAWKWKVKVKSLSRARLLATPWTAAYQGPLSMGFSGKSTGVGCHCLLPDITILNLLLMLCESLSRVGLFATPWTVVHQAPLSMGFSRQEYCSELPFCSPRESSWPGVQTQVSCIAGRFFTFWATREALVTSVLLIHNVFVCRLLV